MMALALILMSITMGCELAKRPQEARVADIHAPGSTPLYRALGYTKDHWQQLIHAQGQVSPGKSGLGLLALPVAPVTGGRSAGVGSSCSAGVGEIAQVSSAGPSTYGDVWNIAGVNPIAISLGDVQGALHMIGSSVQCSVPSAAPGPKTLGLVESARGVGENIRTCRDLLQLYQEAKKMQGEPNCFRRAWLGTQLAVNPQTFSTLVKGAAILEVTGQVLQRVAPRSAIAQEVDRVRSINRNCVLPMNKKMNEVQQGITANLREWGQRTSELTDL